MEGQEYELKKEQGALRRTNKSKNGRHCEKDSRSKYLWGKCDKVRRVRRKADRSSHHRRRNQVRNAQARGLEGPEQLARVSSSKRGGNAFGHSQHISNRKM